MPALTTLIFLAFIGVCGSQTPDCSYSGLLNHLNLTSTSLNLEIIRPVKNWTMPTNVLLDMLLYGILEVNEKSQTITSHIWLNMVWKNEFLSWNPSDFCGIDSVTVPGSRLWIPDIIIQEDASDSGSIQDSPYIVLKSNGLSSASRRQRLTFTCQFDLFLFPFDVQSCHIRFTSMSYTADSLTLGAITSDTTLTFISEHIMVTHGEWRLINIELLVLTLHEDIPGRSQLMYTVTLMRKPLLYVIDLIIPLFYFLILDLASFFINEARGEKLSFKVTILLSISVLLLILKDMLPSTEDNLPMIARYCVSIFTLVGISLLESMLVSFLVDLDVCCAHRSVKAKKEIQPETSYHQEPIQNPLPLPGTSDPDVLKLILEEVKAARQEAARQNTRKKKPGRFQRAAEIIDSVFFVLYFITVVIFMVVMHNMWCENC
ncbi:5-hydroxytryptamine receptor 3A [Echeneis naucrates]|uniref:5-hydroxytryptamine receptor 3A n=1 Tax=Echeneis naucrates TaxID=173247 RepID=UPI00111340AD|nr:5-hydroxytryptamine receptor 3A-like [Echeneis naucrates]